MQKSYNKLGISTAGQPLIGSLKIIFKHATWYLFSTNILGFFKPFFSPKDLFVKAECKILHPQKWSNGEIKYWHKNKSPLSFSLPAF